MSDGEHLEISVCQCGGGVPDPRHSAAGEEGGASPATLTAHVFFGQRPCCLGVLLRRCCVSVWWWGAWSSTQRRRGRGGGISSNTHRSCFLRTAAMLPWSPVASLLCVSVVVGCLVLDTAPQGKREGGGWASPATLTAHCALGLGWYSCCVVSYIAVP